MMVVQTRCLSMSVAEFWWLSTLSGLGGPFIALKWTKPSQIDVQTSWMHIILWVTLLKQVPKCMQFSCFMSFLPVRPNIKSPTYPRVHQDLFQQLVPCTPEHSPSAIKWQVRKFETHNEHSHNFSVDGRDKRPYYKNFTHFRDINDV